MGFESRRVSPKVIVSLQRQLHPHFLFNALHTISALMHRDIEAADGGLAFKISIPFALHPESRPDSDADTDMESVA